MLLLTSTGDLLRVVTTQAVTTHVHVSFVDIDTSTSAVTPGRTNTNITTATTKTITASPGSGVVRTVKSVSIANTHASTTQGVTVLHTDGTTAVDLLDVQLSPGASLQYDEHHGWTVRDSRGRIMTYSEGGGLPATTSELTTVVLASDVTNNNASANTIADVTGLSFSVVAGETYYFRFAIQYTAAATTTGSRWSISGPGSPTALRYSSTYSLTTTSQTTSHGVSAYDTPAASNATSAATASNLAIIEGFITPSANGTVIARFASEVSSSAIIAKAGSICQYMRVL